MITSQDQLSAQIASADPIPVKVRIRFRARLRSRFHQFLLKEFLSQEEEAGLTRARLARRIGKKPEQVTRWLATAKNLTLNTISDLMLGMAAEPDFSVGPLPGYVHAQPDADSETTPTQAGASETPLAELLWLRKPPASRTLAPIGESSEQVPMGYPSSMRAA